MEEVTRRKFIKGTLATAGVAALGYLCSACGFARANTPDLGTGEPPEDILNPTRSTARTRAPRYLELERSGELRRRERALWAKMEKCDLCPRLCHVNRLAGQRGACSIADEFRLSSFGPHPGEERPLVGTRGSGTIFFANCNLLCAFCQNWEIAHKGAGRLSNHTELANAMLTLQRIGCPNINFVTPTHVVPHIVKALRIAINNGLNTPLVFNSGGYDSLDMIQLLDGIMDIYLPDFKFMDPVLAARFTEGAPDVPYHTMNAVKEMHRQVGTLSLHRGVAYRGLLIRHLVLPYNAAGTDAFVRWVADELGTDTHVNIMGQYRPEFRASEFRELARRTTREEVAQANRWAREAGLRNFH
ncbi:MAG: twin-arginine translocation signal domain-containing protein [Bacteroidales bacterium]|nr:twin-arginine translocation signal domain-containing protein [Bacteroidales bacterium]